MCALTPAEKDNLALMYEGDKARDATSKIRGFLFQDYLTINCLLNDKVEYVCSEYLEDVDVFYEDGTFEFIQVKYYPKTSPDMAEISTDLYYQYLRLQMLNSALKAKPKLCIHRKPQPTPPELDDMKTYIGLGKNLPKTHPTLSDPRGFLRTDVHPLKKDPQKKALFAKMASEDSLKGFLKELKICEEKEITAYKTALMSDLATAFPNSDPSINQDHWSQILLGLAVSYIQRRYTLINPGFNELRVKKTEFDEHIKTTTETEPNLTIAAFLVGEITYVYEDILRNNALEDLQAEMLGRIYRNTILWIKQIGSTEEGQYRLLNTISKAEACEIADYSAKDNLGKLIYISKCSDAFHNFIKYLWKIMLNLGQEKVSNIADIVNHLSLFNPARYIDDSVTDYISLDFEDDKYARHTVILPSAHSGFSGVKRKIVARMVNMSPRPDKWFFENSKIAKGKNYYSYNTADISENPTVADLGRESFYIECMDCIGIDEGDWSQAETCNTCIFSEKCVKGDE